MAEVQGLIARECKRAEVCLVEFDYMSYTGYPLRGVEHYPAWVLPESHSLVQAATRTVRAVVGEKPTIGKWDFSTDGAYTMGIAGIPTIGLGPGEEAQAHTADEHIRLNDCFTAAQIYAQLAVEMLGQA